MSEMLMWLASYWGRFLLIFKGEHSAVPEKNLNLAIVFNTKSVVKTFRILNPKGPPKNIS